MAKIEIDYKQYEDMKNSLKILEEENVKLKEDIETLKSTNYKLNDNISELTESGLFERIFRWNDLLKTLK